MLAGKLAIRRHAAQIGHETQRRRVTDVQGFAVGDGQGEACTDEQIARRRHIDLRMEALRHGIPHSRVGRAHHIAQHGERARASESRQKQAVRLQDTPALDERPRQIVDHVQHAGRDDEIETGGRERKPILITLHAARRRGEARARVRRGDGNAARAEGCGERPIRTTEIQRVREAAGHEVQPIQQPFDHRIAQKGVISEMSGGAIAAQPAKGTVEDVDRVSHGRACAPGEPCGTRRDAPSFVITAESGRADPVIRKAVRVMVDYALPPRCPGCGIIVAEDHSFCLACWQAIDFMGGPACAVCAEPLALALHADTQCGACLADPPPFDRLRAAVAYGPIARALALKLKHGGRAGIARTMARLMARSVGPLDATTLIVPVPLHRHRLWWRGYNQSVLISRALTAQSGGVVETGLLRRTKPTPLLRGLGPSGRRRAIAGAFSISPGARDRLKGARVLLVDDVYTTGATVAGCARTLRKAGAAHVSVACWARVVKDGGEPVETPIR